MRISKLIGAVVGLFAPQLFWIGFIVGLVLGLVNAFKQGGERRDSLKRVLARQVLPL